MKIYSNIVPESKVRKVQEETLEILAGSLIKSFGPMGSSTAIVKNIDKDGVNISIEYTKDGYTIIKSILFQYPIERSVQDLLVDLTGRIANEVGDGTTSAVLLCNHIFKQLCSNEILLSSPPSDILKKFDEVVTEVNKRIMSKTRECTLDDIYKIALISTNDNKDISMIIRNVYEKYGMDVYIDIGISNEIDNIVKEYDGMTLDTGYTDICFVNNKTDNTCSIRNPKIYCFNDPIDTPEMLNMLDAILYNNILRCYAPNSVYEEVPTVIFCKQLSPDASSYFETIVKLMNSGRDVPLLMVSDIHQDYLYEDITKMCGAPLIKKYLNPEIQQKDVEAGLAPTPETILDFCGHAELVKADQYKTKIIRPAKMFNENGEYSDDYKMMVNYLETQVEKAKQEDQNFNEIGKLKRRLNSFKGNMIDFLVGGVSLSDRNNLKAAVEDAVLNCRSACKYGVGYGANYMALSCLHEMINDGKHIENPIVRILYDSYMDLCTALYEMSYPKSAEDIVNKSLEEGCPLNIRTNSYDSSVLSSIKSDVTILETINKILTLMYTCNQYVVQTPMHNVYLDDK